MTLHTARENSFDATHSTTSTPLGTGTLPSTSSGQAGQGRGRKEIFIRRGNPEPERFRAKTPPYGTFYKQTKIELILGGDEVRILPSSGGVAAL